MNVIEELIHAYRNENSTFIILQYKNNIISNILDMITVQKDYVKTLDNFPVIKAICEQELERVKYFISQYLKLRIKKIQSYHSNIIIENLSDKEKEFYYRIIQLYKEIDVYHTNIEEEGDIVGFIAVENLGYVVLDGNDAVQIQRGDFFIADIKDVYSFLDNGEIILL
ncbi:Sld5 domain protein [Spraguea lophii 42_110]|uniref:Sld5 domain protein n=1 Tax=Spraguea lophii (strain 42_110) TaxID=1358809 RepID=S7WBW7_SPRLO|nr:Sld5 domain protein [Spraguea lophii 42_110]